MGTLSPVRSAAVTINTLHHRPEHSRLLGCGAVHSSVSTPGPPPAAAPGPGEAAAAAAAPAPAPAAAAAAALPSAQALPSAPAAAAAATAAVAGPAAAAGPPAAVARAAGPLAPPAARTVPLPAPGGVPVRPPLPLGAPPPLPRFPVPLVGVGRAGAPPPPGPAVVLVVVARPLPPVSVLSRGARPIRRQVNVSVGFPELVVGVSEHMKEVAVLASRALLYFKQAANCHLPSGHRAEFTVKLAACIPSSVEHREGSLALFFRLILNIHIAPQVRF